jgi:hypothetical protein
MKELIAIVTCHASKYRDRANAQRATWAQHAKACGYDLKFFLGRPPNWEQPCEDEIFLDVDDGYHCMPAKTRALCQWALAARYDYLFKTDDDVYVNMAALRKAPKYPHDYVGRFRGPSGGYPADYASGYAYWLSKKAMKIVAAGELTDDWAEDRWVANLLAKHGIAGWSDDRSYVACYPPVLPELIFDGQLRHRVAWCEFPPALMLRMYTLHNANRTVAQPVTLRAVPLPGNAPRFVEAEPEQTIEIKRKPKDLSKLCVLIKTFLRDGYLFDCMAGIENNLPEVKMVIIDDGHPTLLKDLLYDRLRKAGHVCEYVPYDSGFGEKSNIAIQYYDRPYVLIASDDFDLSDSVTRHGIEMMVQVLDGNPDIAVASGRVANNPYEAILEIDGDTVNERPLRPTDPPWVDKDGVRFRPCDLTVNYSVIRTAVLGKDKGQACWDGGEVKIGGGEHGAFYMDLKKEGHKVVVVAGANVETFRYDPSKQAPLYDSMRARARQPGRVCLKRRGINRWILQDGSVELT